ncbi:MAG: hypothetical protein LQ344_007901 [Seirophora lacunosa]|nr:MAG: hypothetical protein LQ344_007901 [Seirophora lacunosa]
MHHQICQIISLLAAASFGFAAPNAGTTNVLATYEELPETLVAAAFTQNKGLNCENFGYISKTDITTTGLSAITPQSPQYKAFSPKFFSLGCAVRTREAVVNVAAPCNVKAKGYDLKGKMVAEAEFAFVPGLKLVRTQEMKDQVFPPELDRKLGRVTFESEAQALVVVLADDFGYRMYT